MANEKRLIDANALVKDLEFLAKYEDSFRQSVILGVVQTVNTQRTVDAVEVVRCKDCKHAWIHPCGYVYCHRGGRNAYEMTFNLDNFCSYGEQKDGDWNG